MYTRTTAICAETRRALESRNVSLRTAGVEPSVGNKCDR